jgi:hypothetical protein
MGTSGPAPSRLGSASTKRAWFQVCASLRLEGQEDAMADGPRYGRHQAESSSSHRVGYRTVRVASAALLIAIALSSTARASAPPVDIHNTDPSLAREGWSQRDLRRAKPTRGLSPKDLKLLVDRTPALRYRKSRLHAASASPFDLPWRNYGYGTFGTLPYIGILTYKTDKGVSKRCTASVVGYRVVLTAAHCVRDSQTKAWFNSFQFAPGINGPRFYHPYGTYNATRVTTPAGYATYQDGRRSVYDYAFLRMDKPVSPTTGAVGLWANAPQGGAIFADGYPGSFPGYSCSWAWCQPWYCYSPGQGYLQILIPTTKRIVGISCTANNGVSGGPWLMRWEGDGKWYATSVHSFCVYTTAGGDCASGNARSYWGPYFDQGTVSIWKSVVTQG